MMGVVSAGGNKNKFHPKYKSVCLSIPVRHRYDLCARTHRHTREREKETLMYTKTFTYIYVHTPRLAIKKKTSQTHTQIQSFIHTKTDR